MISRRRPLSLPYEDQVPALAAIVAGEQGSGGTATAIDPARADPERLTSAALHHNLAAYAAAAVESGAVSLAPELVRTIASSGALRALQSRRLRRALSEVAPALEAACGARPVLIKGPAIAERLYAEPRLRPFADLDLLVPHERLAAAAVAARDFGYETVEEFRPGFGERHGHDVKVRRSGTYPIDVSIHWRVGDDPVGVALDHRRLSIGAEPLDPAEPSFVVPARPEELVCLAVHFLSDRNKRLIWLNDIALASRACSAAEWERAFALADELGAGWILARALDYAARHLGFERERPRPAGPAPAFGPLRAVEELDARASTHMGRLAALRWRERPGYLRDVLVPTRAGLRGTVGEDGAPTWRLVWRHVRSVVAGVRPRR